MAKINIKFNNTDYSIDEARLSDILVTLKSHFSTAMSGSDATIHFDGVDYSIDSTKLTAAKNVLVERLGAISGSDSKVVIGGVEHGIDSAKVGDAIADLHTAFEELEAGGEEADALKGVWRFPVYAEIRDYKSTLGYAWRADHKVILVDYGGMGYESPNLTWLDSFWADTTPTYYWLSTQDVNYFTDSDGNVISSDNFDIGYIFRLDRMSNISRLSFSSNDVENYYGIEYVDVVISSNLADVKYGDKLLAFLQTFATKQ